MQINIEKNYIELTPERSDERAKLETIWKMMVDCVRFNKKLVPMGEYIPPENEYSQVRY